MRPALALVLLAGACDGAPRDTNADGAVVPADASVAADAFVGCSAPCTTGCAPETIVNGGMWQVALDATHLYWTNRSAGTVARRAYSGGPAEVVTTGLADPDAFAVDGDQVYVVDYGPGLNSRLVRAPVSGGAWEQVGVIGGLGGDLAFDADRVYVTRWGEPGSDDPGGIVSFPKTGGAMTTILAEVGLVTGMVLEDDTIYFAGGTGVGRATKDGGSVTMLATLANAIELHAWGDDLYASAIQPPEVEGPVGLWRVGKAGGQTQLVDTYVGDFAVDGCGIVVAEGYGGIRTMGLDGSAGHSVAAAEATAIAIDGQSVFWTAHLSGLFVAPR
jgi:hypothetical protein